MSGNSHWTFSSGFLGKTVSLAMLIIALMALFVRGAPAQQCPSVQTDKLYRFVDGEDHGCAIPMTQEDIQEELHDPFWTGILSKGNWPSTVAEFETAVNKAFPSWSLSAFLVGEGMQVPVSVVDRDANRDLRYVLAWGIPNDTPSIFLSARPPQVQGGTTETALDIISLDSQKHSFNFYQFINSEKRYAPPPATWTWSGDSHSAWRSSSAAKGCFRCHLNGGLNMKELEAPWNNWHANSPGQLVNPANVPAALVSDSLFKNLVSAQLLETVVKGTHANIFAVLLRESSNGNTVNNVPLLLRHLILNTTVNFASSQERSDAHKAVDFPRDFFFNVSALTDASIGLNSPSVLQLLTQLRLDSKIYSDFIRDKDFRLVNCSNGTPKYVMLGTTVFAGFIPVPAFEDLVAIRELIDQKIISAQFAASILMVDFQNPVFSKPRGTLMAYANQIQTATLVPSPDDVPTQFANLVREKATACSKSDRISQCTPEEQFLYYNRPNWKFLAKEQITKYLINIQRRISGNSDRRRSVNDYMALSVSRGIQFANWNPVCNLDEKELLLPCTSLGAVWKQMNVDGTVSPQSPYECNKPPPAPCSCSASAKNNQR